MQELNGVQLDLRVFKTNYFKSLCVFNYFLYFSIFFIIAIA